MCEESWTVKQTSIPIGQMNESADCASQDMFIKTVNIDTLFALFI